MGQSPTAVWPGVPRDPRRSGPRARRPAQRWRWKVPLALAIAATLAATVALALLYARPDASGRSLLVRLEDFAGEIGLGLDQIEVEGHRFTTDSDILDAVDLPHVRSYLSFDSAAVRARIERLAWVDTATIERRLPNRVAITITERRPFAAWERGARDMLIDATGRLLSAVARNSTTDLPRIAGEQAPEDARRILDLVSAYPDLAARLAKAERVSGRRWRLVLRDTTVIELPAEADAAALATLVEQRPEGRLIDIDAAVIDLTVLRRITIRPQPPHKRG